MWSFDDKSDYLVEKFGGKELVNFVRSLVQKQAATHLELVNTRYTADLTYQQYVEAIQDRNNGLYVDQADLDALYDVADRKDAVCAALDAELASLDKAIAGYDPALVEFLRQVEQLEWERKIAYSLEQTQSIARRTDALISQMMVKLIGITGTCAMQPVAVV